NDYQQLVNSPFPADETQKKAMHDLSVRSRAAYQQYEKDSGASFHGLTDFGLRASALGWLTSVLNCLAAVVVACFFTAVVTVGYGIHTRQLGKFDIEPLLIATALFLTWFPLRLYAEWYWHFFTLELRTYPAFLLLLFLALVSLVWLVFIVRPARAVITIPAIASVLSVAFVVIGAAKPEVLWFVASAFDSMPWQYVAALRAIVVVSVALIVTGVVRRRGAPENLDVLNPS